MKNIFKSKTIWVNALTLVANVGGVLPPKYASTALILSNVANIGLRLITSQAVSIAPK